MREVNYLLTKTVPAINILLNKLYTICCIAVSSFGISGQKDGKSVIAEQPMKNLTKGNWCSRVTSSFSPSRFLHFLAVSETPSNSNGREVDLHVTTADPLILFTNYAKSRQFKLRSTRIFHTQLLSKFLLQDTFTANLLIECYCKSSVMDDALKVFDHIPYRNVISWNTMISGYNYQSLFLESCDFFCRMLRSGFNPDEFTYGSVLSACTSLLTPSLGMQIYSLCLKDGSFSSGFVQSGMIDLLSKNNRFVDALRVFNDIHCENIVCWNAVISGAVKNGETEMALGLFQRMTRCSLLPNGITLASVLRACAALGDLESGKRVQGWVVKCISSEDVFVGTSVLDLYAKCGDMNGAMKLFMHMPYPNVVSWTAVISGFVHNDECISALQLFRKMRNLGEEINNYTITSVLTACGKQTLTRVVAQIHAWIIECGFHTNPSVADGLMNTYSKLGDIRSSEMVFMQMETVNNLSNWSALLSAYAENKDFTAAIQLFKRMLMLHEGLRPDQACVSSLLSAAPTLDLGMQVHSHLIKSGLVFDLFVSSALFTMYSKCGCLEESYEIFEQIHEKDNVSWASMMAGFIDHGLPNEAVLLFRRMLAEGYVPEEVTFKTILIAFCRLHLVNKGMEIHAIAFRTGLFDEVLIGSALVKMYSSWEYVKLARSVFDLLPQSQRDNFAYCSMISGYAQKGHIEEAILLFRDMQVSSDLSIDSSCVSSVLGAAALLNRIGVGKQFHSYITKTGLLHTDVSVGSSLMTLYSKCGVIDNCRRVFDEIEKPDLICWTSMIGSYAQHGKAEEGLRIFERMKDTNGVKPDAVTFARVLSACSHSGLIEEGYFHFNSIVKDYGIKPNYHHYTCMVDLLGRAGRLKEAKMFIDNMPIQPNAFVWETLLAACKVHGDIELGKLAAKNAVKSEPAESGAYVSLSNIFADMGHWEEVLKIRNLMEGTGSNKQRGWSSI